MRMFPSLRISHGGHVAGRNATCTPAAVNSESPDVTLRRCPAIPHTAAARATRSCGLTGQLESACPALLRLSISVRPCDPEAYVVIHRAARPSAPGALHLTREADNSIISPVALNSRLMDRLSSPREHGKSLSNKQLTCPPGGNQSPAKAHHGTDVRLHC